MCVNCTGIAVVDCGFWKSVREPTSFVTTFNWPTIPLTSEAPWLSEMQEVVAEITKTFCSLGGLGG